MFIHICSERGRITISIINHLNRFAKTAYPRKDREKLVKSQVVLMLLAMNTDRGANGSVTCDLTKPPAHISWFHLTYVHQRPWEIFFSEVQESEGCSIADDLVRTASPYKLVVPDRYVELVYCNNYLTPFEFAANLNTTFRCVG